MDEREREIRERAYAIWEKEGRPHGEHDQHWHRARKELDDTPAPPEKIDAIGEPDDKGMPGSTASLSGEATADGADAGAFDATSQTVGAGEPNGTSQPQRASQSDRPGLPDEAAALGAPADSPEDPAEVISPDKPARKGRAPRGTSPRASVARAASTRKKTTPTE